jgi:hypothetical protein
MKAEFRDKWLNGEKWIEARLIEDVGRLQEWQWVDVQGLGWARVYHVVSVRSVEDLKVLLGCDLKGLGVTSVQHLCSSCNMDRRLLDLGHLILFNLHFFSHDLGHLIASGAGDGKARERHGDWSAGCG